MKPLLLISIIAIIASSANAQYNDTNLGFRLGLGDGYSAEISYETPLKLKSNKRLDLNIGMGGGQNWNAINSIYSNVIYKIGNYIDAGWQWHYGLGISGGMSTYDGPDITQENIMNGDKFINLGIVPVIGIEKHYKKIPINLTIEIRPNIPLINIDYSYWGTLGFALRYRL
ncbi:MAG: hypothetical protein KBG80_03895 [Breznakibacter sp.]|nr:hypothetical protein [Breznakibacter sp.]